MAKFSGISSTEAASTPPIECDMEIYRSCLLVPRGLRKTLHELAKPAARGSRISGYVSVHAALHRGKYCSDGLAENILAHPVGYPVAKQGRLRERMINPRYSR